MKKKRFTKSVSFFATEGMYYSIKQHSDELQLGQGELLRQIVEDYFRSINKEVA